MNTMRRIFEFIVWIENEIFACFEYYPINHCIVKATYEFQTFSSILLKGISCFCLLFRLYISFDYFSPIFVNQMNRVRKENRQYISERKKNSQMYVFRHLFFKISVLIEFWNGKISEEEEKHNNENWIVNVLTMNGGGWIQSRELNMKKTCEINK